MYFVVVLYIKDFTKDVVGKLVSYRFHILNEDLIFEYSFVKFEISLQNLPLYTVKGLALWAG